MSAPHGLIRVGIVDDHPVVRDGLAAILGLQPDIKVVGEAETGREACALFDRQRPDVLLLDLKMPGMDGLEVVQTLCAAHPEARIVILTTYGGDEDIFRSLKAGAKGYLLKDAPRQQILEAIRTVHAGGRYLPAAIVSKVAEHALRPELTGREREVLQGMARGASNKEIGVALSISEGTVKTHVKAILAKLDAVSRTEAVTIATRRGIIRD
ncbi:MAG: response regulator transcription factor [Acetobacteraceae bacterium]|nr:response regulator transcription factor [Acetobacteraceae bacterium]